MLLFESNDGDMFLFVNAFKGSGNKFIQNEQRG